MNKKSFKRLLDFVVALIALIVLSPFLVVVYVWLTIVNKGAGALFLQDRPGKNCKIFKIIKFKTMTDERDENGELLPDVMRLTKVGKFIRSLSIDELPQLINVLKGEMSLIGPRPLVPVYLKVFDEFQLRRQEVRPGITGWSQVHGRNLMKLSKKFEYDVWYVDHVSLLLDINILFKTITNVFARKGVGEGSANMKDVDDLHILERLKSMKL